MTSPDTSLAASSAFHGGPRRTSSTETPPAGRVQQLWLVRITRAEDGKELVRGQVRLQNVALPGS